MNLGDNFVLAKEDKASKSQHLLLQWHNLVCAHCRGGFLLLNLFEHHSVRVLAQAQLPPQESMSQSQILHHQDEILLYKACRHRNHCSGDRGGLGFILRHDPPQDLLLFTQRRTCLPRSPQITQSSSKEGLPWRAANCPPNYQSIRVSLLKC